MLSRHFLRSKVLQSLYACEYGSASDVLTAEKNYSHNINRLNDLGLLQISSLIHLWEMADVMIEEGRNKFIPTQEERNPSTRLVRNEFLRRLADNYELKSQISNAEITWNNEEELFRKSFTNLRKTELYKEYIAGASDKSQSEKHNLWEEDKVMAINLFRYLMNDEGLISSFVERSLWWEDDFYQVAQYIMMFLKTLDQDNFDEAMVWPKIFDIRNEKDVEDFEFSRQLLLITLRNRKENDELIKSHLKGWEFDRVSTMDILMINMAITELTNCPSIPEKVTIDEYIELSKEYSSEKSKLFINGIVDKLILELRSEGKIRKTGRGIIGEE